MRRSILGLTLLLLAPGLAPAPEAAPPGGFEQDWSLVVLKTTFFF